MTLYDLLKLAHVSSVVISGSLFIYRFALMNKRPDQPLPKTLKIVPHINDTILLGAALGMLYVAGINPFTTPWLFAKILALVAYIVIGAISMRSTPGSKQQTVSFVAAISVFAYILLVGLSKQVMPI